MAPIIEVSDNVLKGLKLSGVEYTIPKNVNINTSASDDFIYIPKLKLHVARERSHLGENWYDSHRLLQKQNQRMLTIPEFTEVLKYTRENEQDVYNEIMQVRSPWRAEWLDADFKMKDGKLYINSNHIYNENGDLNPQSSRILQKNTLMKDKTPGISLDSWLENPTKQGLPRKDIKEGDLYYWNPRSNNNSVAGFDAGSDGAYLFCSWNPSDWDSDLGVRAVRHE